MSNRPAASRSRLLALEPRILFDGAMADAVPADPGLGDAVRVEAPLAVAPAARDARTGPSVERTGAGNLIVEYGGLDATEAANLHEAVERVDQLLKSLAASDRFAEAMVEAFGRDAARGGEFTAALEAVRTQLAGEGLGIEVVVRSARDLQGAAAAYASVAHLEIEAVYLNADWLALVTPSALSEILVEELAHALDQRLNGHGDSTGSEGQRFAQVLEQVRASAAAADSVNLKSTATKTVPQGA